MAVKIRLRRMGQKKAPFYRIVGYPAYTRTDRTAPREPEAGNPPAWY